MYQLTFCAEAWYNFYSIKMLAKAPVNFPQICVKWFLHACHFILLHGELSSRGGEGGHLGIFWLGMCRLGLQIGTPF